MPEMLAGQRQHLIAEEIRRRGAMRVSELTELLGVSDMTIRRDLDVLAGSGLIEKVHGGATARRALSTDEPGFEPKSRRQFGEKEAIAEAASRLVEPGQAIALSAGTTTWRLAHCLADVPDLTVVTNSMQVANVLHRQARPDLTVVLIGGVRTPSDALVGPIAVTALRSLHVDTLFLGAHGVDLRAGLTTPNLVESETNRALVSCARRTCVLVDSTKFGVVGLSSFLDLAEVDVLITDSELSAHTRTAFSEAVTDLVVAGRGQRRIPREETA